MGLFKSIKDSILFNRMIKQSFREQQAREALYMQMSPGELSKLTDDELFCAALIRTERAADAFPDNWPLNAINALNEKQRVFYSVNFLITEVNNGGICQFFVNSSRMVAPKLSEYLGIIGAADHQKLYDDFISKYNIDVNDLSSFRSDTTEKFIAQYERYPFDEYDNAFFTLKPLEEYLAGFVRANITYF